MIEDMVRRAQPRYAIEDKGCDARLMNQREFVIQLGFSFESAEMVARRIANDAARNAIASGRDGWPIDQGDQFLSAKDAESVGYAGKLIHRGVRPDDIRLWWNRSERDRQFFMKADDFLRDWAIDLLESVGVSSHKSESVADRCLPSYADHTMAAWRDSSGTNTARLKLPYELRFRVVQFLESRVSPCMSVDAVLDLLKVCESRQACLNDELAVALRYE